MTQIINKCKDILYLYNINETACLHIAYLQPGYPVLYKRIVSDVLPV